MNTADILEKAADLIEPEGAWAQAGRSCPSGPYCMGFAIEACGVKLDDDSGIWPALRAASLDTVDSIIAWNDAPERTQAEVVAKLREAAALAREMQS